MRIQLLHADDHSGKAEVEFVDAMSHHLDEAAVRERIAACGSQWVGDAVITPAIDKAAQRFPVGMEVDPSIVTVPGGIHCTLMHPHVPPQAPWIADLVHNRGVGFFMLADGEPTIHRRTFVELCKALIPRVFSGLRGIDTRVTDEWPDPTVHTDRRFSSYQRLTHDPWKRARLRRRGLPPCAGLASGPLTPTGAGQTPVPCALACGTVPRWSAPGRPCSTP